MKLLCQSEVHSKSRKVCRSQGARVTLSDTFFCTFVADLRWSQGWMSRFRLRRLQIGKGSALLVNYLLLLYSSIP